MKDRKSYWPSIKLHFRRSICLRRLSSRFPGSKQRLSQLQGEHSSSTNWSIRLSTVATKYDMNYFIFLLVPFNNTSLLIVNILFEQTHLKDTKRKVNRYNKSNKIPTTCINRPIRRCRLILAPRTILLSAVPAKIKSV